jgi:hypothetical protein
VIAVRKHVTAPFRRRSCASASRRARIASRSLFETLDDVSLVGSLRDVVGNGLVAVGLADDALQLPYSSATIATRICRLWKVSRTVRMTMLLRTTMGCSMAASLSMSLRLVEHVLLTHAPNDVVELAAPDHDLRLL